MPCTDCPPDDPCADAITSNQNPSLCMLCGHPSVHHAAAMLPPKGGCTKTRFQPSKIIAPHLRYASCKPDTLHTNTDFSPRAPLTQFPSITTIHGDSECAKRWVSPAKMAVQAADLVGTNAGQTASFMRHPTTSSILSLKATALKPKTGVKAKTIKISVYVFPESFMYGCTFVESHFPIHHPTQAQALCINDLETINLLDCLRDDEHLLIKVLLEESSSNAKEVIMLAVYDHFQSNSITFSTANCDLDVIWEKNPCKTKSGESGKCIYTLLRCSPTYWVLGTGGNGGLLKVCKAVQKAIGTADLALLSAPLSGYLIYQGHYCKK
ncbi:hypothetical protein L218DRAFT_1003698 [Marasmius fiardii PR-910]|nr:hypothetical protein L218DRAFT_1003698 [Marasmius fiardii PR-910]